MSFTSSIRAALIALLAVILALPLAGQAQAAPRAKTVDATVQRVEHSAIVRIAQGSMNVEDGFLVVRNDDGQTLEKVRLAFINTDDRTYPIEAQVRGRTATLTPVTDVARSKATPATVLAATEAQRPKQVAKRNVEKRGERTICGPETRKQRDLEALNRMNSELATATTIGGVVGGIIGAIVTIPVGALIGGLIGVVAGAAIGFGGAAIAGTFTRYFKTINSKFKPKWCTVK